MSTRSGKRIHGSFHENTTEAEDELIVKSGRKTRSKRFKENFDETLTTTVKKRSNYVTYPKSEEEDINENIICEKKSKIFSPIVTLKEQNLNVSTTIEEAHPGKSTRQTRRTKKSIGVTEDISNKVMDKVPKKKKNSKKSKKKKTEIEPEVSKNKVVPVAVTKKSKKRRGKQEGESVALNKSNGSVDSFHSAAGSPVPVQACPSETIALLDLSHGKSPRRSSKRKPEMIDYDNGTEERSAKKTKQVDRVEISMEANDCSGNTKFTDVCEKKDATFDKSDKVTEENTILNKTEEKLNTTFEKEPKNRRKSTTLLEISREANDFPGKTKSIDVCEKKDATFDKSNEVVEPTLNTTFEKEPRNRKKSSLKNTTFDKSNISILELNSTYDKTDILVKSNSTFEKDNKPKKRSLRSNTAIEDQEPVETLNNTYEKSKLSTSSLNSTYDKDIKLNVTKEKVDSDKKSSLISTDSSTNLTFDKSNCSRISITSDESNVENIVNTTPVLIESSMDDSQRLDTSPTENKNCSQKKSNSTMTPEGPKALAEISATPLKREGTFTKDGPDVVIMSPKPKLSSERTPVKRMSLPSPGCTPFHVSRSSQKEKSALNVTHSIEKVGRQSSVIEPIPRTTKVMFCSPVNNLAVVVLQKKKVIKSNLKGSNKSFIFDESVSEQPRAAPRKRSYTQNDADDTRAKRSRLGDAQHAAAQRLSRPRTVSATVKLSEPSTPSKKQSGKSVTPSKGKSDAKVSRTKLPNFAALHQKQFARMESLDECQERKAKRAKQLLTPTGAVNVLDRSSPRTTGTSIAEPVKEPAKKSDTPTKAPRTSTKSATQTKLPLYTQPKSFVVPTQTKLPTLESLRPGFTRFGFKMQTVFNPFSVPPKTDSKPKEFKPNGLMKRQLTLPSLNGATTRKEAAKQLVMREKSFTSLSDKRDVKRKENRSMIKGVRTNRRFELQMQMRNMNA